MNTTTKYIVVKLDDTELLFSFPSVINHDDMWFAIQHVKCSVGRSWDRPYIRAKVVSAGFVSPMGICHGHSETLKVKSRNELDTRLYCGPSNSKQGPAQANKYN